jgi:formiminoglutamase
MLARTGPLINPEFEIDIKSRVKVYDLGDVPVPDFTPTPSTSDPLAAMHDDLKSMVKWALERRMIPFVVGGGNDQSYAVASGLMEYIRENKRGLGGKDFVGVVNVDAHLDVRPLVDGVDYDGKSVKVRHSGCPFRLLLEVQIDNHQRKNRIELSIPTGHKKIITKGLKKQTYLNPTILLPLCHHC